LPEHFKKYFQEQEAKRQQQQQSQQLSDDVRILKSTINKNLLIFLK
jgi:hypothetical protein